MLNFRVLPIKRNDFKPWLLYKHYAHRIPSVSYAFGLYDIEKILQGVCTFGMPASKDLCNYICGKEFNSQVLELNRLVVSESIIKNRTSYFVGHCLKLIPKPRIIVSYADTGQNHQGYIYQATNFIFTGKTRPRKDLKVKGRNLHSRHAYDNPDLETKRVERTVKNRYVYFLGSKKQLKIYKINFKLNSLPYPKGDNKRYDASYNPKTQGLLF